LHTIAQHLQTIRQTLAPIAGENAALEARLLAQAAWGISAEQLVRNAHEPRAGHDLQTLVNRRLQREPVAQILGYKDFWRDRFVVSRDVLTPRADSEVVIETLLRHRPNKNAALRVLDLGTGSGCLLLSALREYPQATGVGVDQSLAALEIAAKNAAALGVQHRCELMQSNWCSHVRGTFDVVIANPPYIPTNDIAALDADVRLHEPLAALDGGADGLDAYRRILQQIAPHLAANASLLFEVGQGQDVDLVTLGQGQDVDLVTLGQVHGLRHVETAADLACIARVVAFAHAI
jgi:release factor glutamine methyltransferase